MKNALPLSSFFLTYCCWNCESSAFASGRELPHLLLLSIPEALRHVSDSLLVARSCVASRHLAYSSYIHGNDA